MKTFDALDAMLNAQQLQTTLVQLMTLQMYNEQPPAMVSRAHALLSDTALAMGYRLVEIAPDLAAARDAGFEGAAV